jgi:hypothetical protein
MSALRVNSGTGNEKVRAGKRDQIVGYLKGFGTSASPRLIILRRWSVCCCPGGGRAPIDQLQAENTRPTDNRFLREGRPRGRGLFTSAPAPDVGPVHRVDSATAASRAGASLMVLVRGLTCDCSPKGAQHLRTIRILQADIVKKAIGHIVSVGPTPRRARLSQRSAC